MNSSTRVAPSDAHLERPALALPSSLARPAQRALANAGYTRLDQLAAVSEAEIAQLHGIGPNALAQLRRALADRGLAFAAAPNNDD
jgi:hypothetical protein